MEPKTKEITVLGNSFVKYVDHLGTDSTIVDAARISYQDSSKGEERDKKLLRYLFKNKHCYCPEMEVLTTSGWKRWDDCESRETYLVPYPDKKVLKAETLDLEVFNVSEEITTFKNQSTKFRVTSDHKMWFKQKNHGLFSKVPASKTRWGHFQSGVGYSLLEGGKKWDFITAETDLKMEFIGFYLGDGSYSCKNRITFHLKKERKNKYLMDLLAKNGMEYKVKPSSSCPDASVYWVTIPDWFREKMGEYLMCKARYKQLPIQNFTEKQARGLLQGLINSDGSISVNRPQITFSSTSPHLINTFNLLCSLFGMEAHSHTNPTKCAVYLNSPTEIDSRSQYYATEFYRGNTYCVTSGSGLLLVRGGSRKRSFVCGNTSPFEQVNISFQIRMPIFIMRQFVRHRTFRLNEVSARYTELDLGFYTPEKWRTQDTKNKQSSTDFKFKDEDFRQAHFTDWLETSYKESFKTYKRLLDNGVAREMARMVLPVGALTEIRVNIDLSNLIKYFMLRDDSHAQYEIQEISRAMKTITTECYPWVMEMYEESRKISEK